jgi:hypothetical protein
MTTDTINERDPRDMVDFPPEADTPDPSQAPSGPGWWLWDRWGWVGPYRTCHQAQHAARTTDLFGNHMDASSVHVVCVVNTPSQLQPVTPRH